MMVLMRSKSLLAILLLAVAGNVGCNESSSGNADADTRIASDAATSAGADANINDANINTGTDADIDTGIDTEWAEAFATRDFGEDPGEPERLGALEMWYSTHTGHDPALSYENVAGTFIIDDAWLAANDGNGRVSFTGGRWRVERYRSTGTLRINTSPGTPVTLTNMHVDSAGALYGFQSKTNASDIVLEHSTLAGNFNGGSGALNFTAARDPGQITLRYVDLSGFRAGLYIIGGVTAEYCWSHDLHYTSGSHNTGASIRAGNSVLRRNYITDGNSAAISLYPEYEPYSGVLVEENAVKLQLSDTGMEILIAAKPFIDVQPGETRRVINNLFWRGGNRGEGGGLGGATYGITQAYGNHDRLGASVGPTINP